MRGVVEVIDHNGTVVRAENNLVVDYAARTIVDALTTSPSYAGNDDSSTSSLLDVSNYTIHAISFGKSRLGFRYNNHDIGYYLDDKSGANRFIVLIDDPTGAVSSYIPDRNLPSYPSPWDTKLEACSITPIEDHLGLADQKVGHCLNVLAASAFNADSAASGYVLLGCYPASGGTDVRVYDAQTSSQIGVDLNIKSNFNAKASMDGSGWVNIVNPEGVATAADPEDGLVVSADSDFSSTGRVSYTVDVSGGDLIGLALHGGLWSMGLWTLDNKRIYADGAVTPPYSWDALNNSKRYRLFAKKVFANDLTAHTDSGGVGGLTRMSQDGHKLRIIWSIYF